MRPPPPQPLGPEPKILQNHPSSNFSPPDHRCVVAARFAPQPPRHPPVSRLLSRGLPRSPRPSAMRSHRAPACQARSDTGHRAQLCSPPRRRPRNFGCGRWSTSTTSSARSTSASGSKSEYCSQIMFTTLWMWRQEYQHHEQLPLAFNGTWPSWNSDLDNRPW
jgi:hypothetical protein